MANDPNECFRILDLRPGASLDEIKRSYRELAKVWHPDRFSHDPSLLRKSQEKMRQLNDAYQQLSALLERFGPDAFGKHVAGRAHPAAAVASVPGTHAADDPSVRPSANPPPPRERTEPKPPLASFAKAGDACVRLSWAPDYGAGSYNVKRSLTPGGPYHTIARAIAWTEYVDHSVLNGTRYYYVISSSDGPRESADSPELTVQPCAVPTPPSALTAARCDDGRGVQLQWTQSGSPEICWNLVYRSDGGDEPYVQIAQISAGTTYVDRQVVKRGGAGSRYVVTAVNANAQHSAHSNAAAVPT